MTKKEIEYLIHAVAYLEINTLEDDQYSFKLVFEDLPYTDKGIEKGKERLRKLKHKLYLQLEKKEAK